MRQTGASPFLKPEIEAGLLIPKLLASDLERSGVVLTSLETGNKLEKCVPGIQQLE